jgi:peptidoglycan/LPS O-acetylase OafA/YrhL/lysophospholipase L1-like esterase
MSEGLVAERVAPAPHGPPRLGYIPALDGLRAVAVIAVLLYHGGQKWMPGGFLGVDVFFVISGYLITCLLLADWQQHGRTGLKRFWLRRARRLLPALFTMLFVVSMYAILFLPDVLSQLRGEVLAAVFYVENWFLIFRDLSYFQSAGRPPLLQHVWSLAVEEQFYVLWPLLLALGLSIWGRHKRKLLLAVLVVVVASTVEMAVLYQPYHDPSRAYYGTDTRAAALLLGAALAFVWAPWQLTGKTGRNAANLLDGAALVSGIGLLWMFFNVGELDPGLYRGGFLVAAMVSAILIAATVHPASRLTSWLLGFRVFRWIGVRSYGIYLWHWPVYMVTRPHADVSLTGLPLLALRLAITFAIAAASYRWIEEPVRHGAIERRWALYRDATGDARRRMSTGFGMAAVALGVGVAVIFFGFVGGGTPSAPAGFPKAAAIVLNPTGTTTTAPGQTAPTATTGVVPSTGPAATVPATTVAPAPSAVPAAVTAIGDSVMLGASPELKAAIDLMFGGDITRVDAKESRQFSAGVDAIQFYHDRLLLGQDVIVQLGTNGEVNPADFDRMMSYLTDARRVVIVNAHVDRPWEGEVNDQLAAGVKRYKNTVLLDWHGYGAAHPEFFYPDGIHLRPEGAQAYAQLVSKALADTGSP